MLLTQYDPDQTWSGKPKEAGNRYMKAHLTSVSASVSVVLGVFCFVLSEIQDLIVCDSF